MFEQALQKGAKNSLAILGQSGLLKNAYLAGGTGLALQLGHRISVDFDFFTAKKFKARSLVEQLSKAELDFKLERIEWGTIIGHLGKTKFSLFFYDYPLIDKPAKFLGNNIASIKDIAAMKLLAISERGIKRDFVDLYFILAKGKLLTLKEVFELYEKKFKILRQDSAHLLKSLTYFEDADKTTVPEMLKPADWKKVKKFFEREVKYLAKQEF
ncbi:MAG: nucleotidyl transferase AbiEii/AbiGii toxin family protein [Patescibacteria group bacterium]|nr:nucleotidyl transferase AbiEii/AbiGii toxin family protein [Patescibacteria group bacterium]